MAKAKHELKLLDIGTHENDSMVLSKGHHDKEAFLAEFKRRFGGEWNTVDKVEHGYVRIYANRAGYDRYYDQVEKGRGAVPVTMLLV